MSRQDHPDTPNKIWLEIFILLLERLADDEKVKKDKQASVALRFLIAMLKRRRD